MEASWSAEALRLLGLARRAGAAAPGTEVARRAIRQGEARLILLAEDAARPQREKIVRAVGNQAIPRAVLGDRVTLGAAVGRGPTSAVAVTGASFAKELLRKLGASAVRSEPED